MKTLTLTDFLDQSGMNMNSFANKIGVSRQRVRHWSLVNTCYVQTDDELNIKEVLIMRQKTVYKEGN